MARFVRYMGARGVNKPGIERILYHELVEGKQYEVVDIGSSFTGATVYWLKNQFNSRSEDGSYNGCFFDEVIENPTRLGYTHCLPKVGETIAIEVMHISKGEIKRFDHRVDVFEVQHLRGNVYSVKGNFTNYVNRGDYTTEDMVYIVEIV